ncbi:uncharacterized protein BX663DRAFT_526205 [Cokeromyces recurvatus]|uniref:uncharacterized protein n=1 Tax=Cokeromyces recurvatus TaxID=90255 RepID=UPI0022210CFE|nr:uncharacterized protein BX663DRAFT_526205 [Cokeromyces recurvatus]KAI7898097.1 hypothetical protein BX663DRAFT_526205 [Cokeromyces recurvatus]
MIPGTTPHSTSDFTTETKPTLGDIPPPLVGASTTVVGNKLYLFGGRLVSSRQMINELYILNLDSFIWTHHNTQNAPQARYFHSTSLFHHKLVVFGGMSSYQQGLCALDDICIFDLDSMSWQYPNIPPSIYAPQARYAHLAVICSSNKLVIMGGQDMSNQYINEMNIFDLTTLCWVQANTMPHQYGAYRAVAFCPDSFWHEEANEALCCVYSNYNFTDVTRDLQSFCPFSSSQSVIKNYSENMSGVVLPPGLRFPTGDLLGHHLILNGTYLTPTHRSFHIWALNLSNLVWVRIDTGQVLSQGSWNRGVLYGQRFIVFGDKSRDLLEDYNHRQVNFTHAVVVELEAFGIYVNPSETCAPIAQELGLSMLSELADMEFQTDDGRTIPVNSAVVTLRWPHFAKLSANKDHTHRLFHFPESYSVTLAFLQYIYTDHLMTAQQHQPHILSRLLVLADMYGLSRLAQLATHALHQILTISTASMVYETATLTSRYALQVRALRVLFNAKKMLEQQDPRHLLHTSKSSTTAMPTTTTQEQVPPSPKHSKSSHYPKNTGFLERKSSIVPTNQFIERPNMGVPF